MTAVENLPMYVQAEKLAKNRGLNIDDLLSAYLTGFVAGSGSEQSESLTDDDYTSPDVLPGETVLSNPADTRSHFEKILDEVRRGV